MSNQEQALLEQQLAEGLDIIAKSSDSQISEVIHNLWISKYQIEGLLKEYRENIAPYQGMTAHERLVSDKVGQSIQKRILATNSTNSHYLLVESTSKEYKTLALQFVKDIEREFNCEKASERALAEIIASSYIRYLTYNELLSEVIDRSISSDTSLLLANFYSRQLDRAQRQYLTSLIGMKQIKTQPVEITVKAEAAFIANNQQLNTLTLDVSPSKENL